MTSISIIVALLIVMTIGTYIGITYMNLPNYFWIFPLNGLLMLIVAYIAKNKQPSDPHAKIKETRSD